MIRMFLAHKLYFTAFKYVNSQICVKLAKYLRRAHVGQLQELSCKTENCIWRKCMKLFLDALLCIRCL